MAGILPLTLPSTSSTVSLLRGEIGSAMHDDRDLVVSLPSDASKLFAVSEHTEEVETTHIPVKTRSVNPSSQGCTTLCGINLVSLDFGMTGQVGQASSSSASQISFTNRLPEGSFLRPPPLLLKSGLVGMGTRFPLASQPFSGLPGAPSGFVPPFFF